MVVYLLSAKPALTRECWRAKPFTIAPSEGPRFSFSFGKSNFSCNWDSACHWSYADLSRRKCTIENRVITRWDNGLCFPFLDIVWLQSNTRAVKSSQKLESPETIKIKVLIVIVGVPEDVNTRFEGLTTFYAWVIPNTSAHFLSGCTRNPSRW